MEKELDPNIIKATQTSLGKYVKRPPLSEKLLKKPPFRFLHDIITTVLKTTRFFEGLFEDDELVSDNVKDRESKILFLNKVISVVGLTTGRSLSVKPSKIIAGQEADKTNELLQCLAQALENKLSSDEAVKKFKEGVTFQQATEKKTKEITKNTKKSNDKKLTSKSSDKITNNKKEPSVRPPIKNDNEKSNNLKIKSKDKNESPPKKIIQPSNVLPKKTSIEKQKSLEASKSQKPSEVLSKNNVAENNINFTNKNGESDLDDSKENLSQVINPILDDERKREYEPVVVQSESQNLTDLYTEENQLNSSISSQDNVEGVNDKMPESQSLVSPVEVREENKMSDGDHKRNHDFFEDKVLKKSIEKDDTNQFSFNNTNTTISPKRQFEDNIKNSQEDTPIKSPIKSDSTVSSRPLSVRPSSSRPGAPRLRDKHENVITESENLIVGKVNIIAENAPIEEEEDSSMIIVEQADNSSAGMQEHDHIQLTSSNQHGHLVQQILESQKEFSQIAGKTQIEWQFGAQKAREAVNREIEQLRYNIQGLSRVANPLGKLLDHIQEDVEVMRQELQQWTKTYDEASTELSKQKTLNEDSLFPLRTKVKQLHADIEEKQEKISDMKVVIHKNSIRIEKLLASGNVQ